MLLQTLLSAVAMMVSFVKSEEVHFNQKFPENFNLLKGDIIKISLSDHVTRKGASFVSDPDNRSMFDPSISYQRDVDLIETSAKRCTQVMPSGEDELIMVCNEKYLVKSKMDHTLMFTKESKFLLLNASTFIEEKNQICTDLQAYNGFAYISCVDSTKVTTKNDVVIFKVNLQTMATTFTKCSNDVLGSTMRMVIVPFSSNTKLQFIFLDYSPYQGMPSKIKFNRCIPANDFTNGTTSLSNGHNLVDILGSNYSTLTASIRAISLINSKELLFVLAESSNTDKNLHFAIANMDDDGALTTSKFSLTSFNPGPVVGNFDPRYLGVAVESDTTSTIVSLIDTKMYYKLTLTYNRVSDANKFIINVDQPAFSYLDCGYAAETDVYVSKVFTFSNDSTNYENFRQLIEYRSMSGGTKALKGFAINLYGSDYSCSDLTGAPVGRSYYGVAMISVNKAIQTAEDIANITYYAVQHKSFLVVDTSKLTTPDNTIKIIAKLKGYNDSTQELKFNLSMDFRDNLNVTLQSKEINAYSDSRFTLPYVSENFVGNNLSFSTNSTNVVHKFATSYYPDLNITLEPGFVIARVFAVDHDTFVAALTKEGVPHKYITFYSTIENGKMNLKMSSQTPQQSGGQVLFKIFKMGAENYCMVFKSLASVKSKLTFSCFEDKPDGATKLQEQEIDSIYEVMDIQFLETSQRVDWLMIAAVTEQSREVTKILHYYLRLNSDGTIETAAKPKPISITHPSLSSYLPIDAMFDYIADDEGSNHVTVKMISRTSYPIIAKFNMTFDGENVELKFLRVMDIKHQDVAYCINRNEAILFNRKTRQLYAQQFDRSTGIPNQNQYSFPYLPLDIKYIMQFLCIPEKGVFQVLGVDSKKKKFLITYRGGESFNLGRRLHSITPVDDSVDFIEHGYSAEYIITVAGGKGDTTLKRAFVQIFPEGPFFYVDTKDKKENFSVAITAKNDKKTVTEEVKIGIIIQKYTPEVSVKSTFDYKTGSIMFVEEVTNIDGPVMDVQLKGEVKDLEKVSVIKRNNKHRGINIGTTEKPDKILAKGDFLVAIKYNSYVRYIGDPSVVQKGATSPTLIHTDNGIYRDVALTKIGTSGSLAIFTKEFKDGEFVYCMTILRKMKDTEGKDAFIRESQGKVFSTKEDFDDIQMVLLEEDLVVSMRSKKELISNYIKLLAFKKETGKYKLSASTNLIPLIERRLTSYSLIFIGTRSIAIVAATEGESGLQVAIWDTYAKYLVLVETTTKVEISPGVSRYIQIDYIRCWTYNGTATVQCVFDAEGVTDYQVEMTLNPLYQVNDLDRVSKMVVKGSFEMPPYFNIKRMSRGKDVYTFLVEKSAASKVFDKKEGVRLLQAASGVTIDKFNDCNQLILIYKPEVSRFIFTGITCSEWNNATVTDMSMEDIGGREYIFYTKDGPKDPSKASAAEANERVASNYISGIVLQFKDMNFDPSKIALKFIGLNGQESTENKQLTLDQFKQKSVAPDEPSSSKTWLWILLIVVLVLVIGGALFLFFKNRSSSSTATDYKSDNDKTLNDKEDLEDVRL